MGLSPALSLSNFLVFSFCNFSYMNYIPNQSVYIFYQLLFIASENMTFIFMTFILLSFAVLLNYDFSDVHFLFCYFLGVFVASAHNLKLQLGEAL